MGREPTEGLEDAETQQLEELLERVTVLHEVGRYADAAPLVRQALHLGPDSYDAHCLTALNLLALGDPSEALRNAETAVALQPEEDWGHRIRSLILQGMERNQE